MVEAERPEIDVFVRKFPVLGFWNREAQRERSDRGPGDQCRTQQADRIDKVSAKGWTICACGVGGPGRARVSCYDLSIGSSQSSTAIRIIGRKAENFSVNLET